MRIFYASDTTPNSSFKSNIWRNNLLMPLRDLGHDVIEFQYDLMETFQNLDTANSFHKEFIKKNRPKVSKELLKQIKAVHAEQPIDIFFSYFYDACVLPQTLDDIRSLGIITVNWYCNGSYQLGLVSEISPHYDWCLVPEKFRLEDYLKMGAKPVYCQEASNPYVYKHYDIPYEYDVAFVGQAYGERPEYIKYLIDLGLDVRVWGYGWKAFSSDTTVRLSHTSRNKRFLQIGRKLFTVGGWKKAVQRIVNFAEKSVCGVDAAKPVVLPDTCIGGILSDEEMVKMYSRAKINLGFSTCGDTHQTANPIKQIRLRDFEVPMSGGFYMVEYMEELEEFFDIGKEIVCYENMGDLAEKIKYYLAHEDQREKIRKAGYERCLRDHTWHKRFQKVFKEIGLE